MKARIKATGEIIDVSVIGTLNGNRYRRTDGQNELYESKDLDLNLEAIINPDYWTRLEHTYVGMFMKSFLDNFDGTASMEQLSDDAIALAHALVEKLKEREERK